MSEPIFLCKYCGADYGDNPHPMISCIRNLAAQRDRAEAAEAEKYAYKYVPHLHGYVTDNGILPNDIVRTICCAQHQHQGAMSAVAALGQSHELLRAERDALRKDAERLREAIDKFLSFQGSTREPEGQAALDAALAVQP